jgi:hypothetical protein
MQVGLHQQGSYVSLKFVLTVDDQDELFATSHTTPRDSTGHIVYLLTQSHRRYLNRASPYTVQPSLSKESVTEDVGPCYPGSNSSSIPRTESTDSARRTTRRASQPDLWFRYWGAQPRKSKLLSRVSGFLHPPLTVPCHDRRGRIAQKDLTQAPGGHGSPVLQEARDTPGLGYKRVRGQTLFWSGEVYDDRYSKAFQESPHLATYKVTGGVEDVDTFDQLLAQARSRAHLTHLVHVQWEEILGTDRGTFPQIDESLFADFPPD